MAKCINGKMFCSWELTKGCGTKDCLGVKNRSKKMHYAGGGKSPIAASKNIKYGVYK